MRSDFLRKCYPLIIACAVVVGLYSCKSTETATQEEPKITVSDSVTTSTGDQLNLATYRNTLGDAYASQNHDMPDFFMQAYENQGGNRDPFDGFRIQVVSSRQVSMADSVARSFRVWSDTTIANYAPEAYVFFKQPYYKVHVGDFNNRQRAIEFSRLVKRKYPDAWVVHDRINPYLVPADTVNIALQPDSARGASSRPRQ